MDVEYREIDLSQVDIHEFEIKREEKASSKAEFAVKGVFHDTEDGIIEQVMMADTIVPESLVLRLEEKSSGS